MTPAVHRERQVPASAVLIHVGLGKFPRASPFGRLLGSHLAAARPSATSSGHKTLIVARTLMQVVHLASSAAGAAPIDSAEGPLPARLLRAAPAPWMRASLSALSVRTVVGEEGVGDCERTLWL